MPRLLFEKYGNAIWISHLDLMRVFQRAFKRAGLPLTHTKGFNPRPSVSIALPLSVGIDSKCELLDFDLEGDGIQLDDIKQRLNENLISGIRVVDVYDDGKKIKYLAYLDCVITMEYDRGIPENATDKIRELLCSNEVLVEKKNRNGITQQNIVSMIRQLSIESECDQELKIKVRVCCQNPTLNPMQIPAAIRIYLPEIEPDFVKSSRLEIYDQEENIFR